MTTDTDTDTTKYTLISYRANWNDRHGDTENSEISFDDELTFEKLEERIFQIRADQPDDADYHGSGGDWQFLIFANGIPLGSRGKDFFNVGRWRREQEPAELKPIADEIENLFNRADISSEEKRRAREAEAQRIRDLEHKRYMAQQEAHHYDSALSTLETSLKNGKKIDPNLAFREKRLYEQLKATFEQKSEVKP